MNRFIIIIVLVFVIFITFFWIRSDINRKESVIPFKRSGVHSMKLLSDAFANGENIPSLYTCRGKNINPPFNISGVPQEARSLVFIVDDPDAPGGTWVHWVVYNISSSIKLIAEHSVPKDGIEAITSFGKAEYGGPCPPSGVHHYHFKLYALDATLVFDKPEEVNKQVVEEQMKEHVIDSAELVGLYSK